MVISSLASMIYVIPSASPFVDLLLKRMQLFRAKETLGLSESEQQKEQGHDDNNDNVSILTKEIESWSDLCRSDFTSIIFLVNRYLMYICYG
jgi:hypothetical protein